MKIIEERGHKQGERRYIFWILTTIVGIFAFAYTPLAALAAGTLYLSPESGVYTAGSNFTVRVLVNTGGDAINAAEGNLIFNNTQLSIVGVSQAGSIFNLWTVEPSFSNGAGTISFGGGSPRGYTGTNGQVMTVTFRALKQATSRVDFSSGVILAADGKGTNIISDMRGGVYTLQSNVTTPPPEYVAPDNTPAAPNVRSSTHPDPNRWYAKKDVEFTWAVPSGVTNVRLTADKSSFTIPTVFYDTAIKGRSLENFEDGAWYLHVQFKNEHGWGRVAHFGFNIDSKKPESFTITKIEEFDPTDPRTAFLFEASDTTSGVVDYEIQIDGGETISWRDDGTHIYKLDNITPDEEHTMVVKALDRAGNHLIETIIFTVDGLPAPRITDYPEVLNSGSILVIRGETISDGQVTLSIKERGEERREFLFTADEEGKFTYILEEKLADGVYQLWAEVADGKGAISGPSETITFAVRPAGIIKFGSVIISYLSILVPILALLLLALLVLLYMMRHVTEYRRKVRKEATEAEHALAEAFTSLHEEVATQVRHLEDARTKRELTKEEAHMVDVLNEKLDQAEKDVRKEIRDIKSIRMNVE